MTFSRIIMLLVFFQINLIANPEAPLENPFDPYLKEAPLETPSENRFLGEFFYMLLMLGLLIGSVLFASYYIKRLMYKRIENLNTSSSIKILESRPLSQRAHLHIVEIEDEKYVVAESASSASIIKIKSCRDSEI